jgi:hypothetical protein
MLYLPFGFICARIAGSHKRKSTQRVSRASIKKSAHGRTGRNPFTKPGRTVHAYVADGAQLGFEGAVRSQGRLALLVLDVGTGEDFDLLGIHPDGISADFGRI